MPETPDAAALARLHADCFRHPRPWSAGEFEVLLGSPHVFLCVRPGGFALGRAVAGEAELLTIAVRPDGRRRGQGRALLADILAEAGRRGASDVFLEVAAGNAAALALYRGSGFVETGRRPHYYAGPKGREDALILRRGIGPAFAAPVPPS